MRGHGAHAANHEHFPTSAVSGYPDHPEIHAAHTSHGSHVHDDDG